MMHMNLNYSEGFGFFDGLSDDDAYLRGNFVHGLVAYAGLSAVAYRGNFIDLNAGDPYAGDWQIVWDEHWVDMANNRARNGETLTAADMMALLSRVIDLPLSDPLWKASLETCGLDEVVRLTVGQARELLSLLLQKLDERIFAEPTAKFRIHSMEHDVSREPETIKPLVIDTYGGGAVINAAWDDNWNGDPKNLDNLYETAERLRDAGLHAWLYDEKVYPSGWAGGYIMQEGKDYTGKNLGVIHLIGEGRRHVQEVLPERGLAFVQAAFYKAGDYESPIEATWDTEKIDTESPDGEWEFMAFYIRHCNIWPYAFAKTISPPIGPREHLNFLDKEAVAAFIEGALGRVRDHNPAFGELFEAVFTDEPDLKSFFIYGDANKPAYKSVPYGSELFDRFLEWNGEDLRPLLPYLYFGNDERARSVRVAFYRTVARLMSDNFTGQVAEWCHNNHVNYSGHYHGEECLYLHVGNYGDYLQVASQADRPGFDMLCGTHRHFWETGEGVVTGANFLTGKYLSSVSRMKGGNTTMVEVCPTEHDAELKASAESIEDNFMGLSTDTAFIGATHFNNYGYHFVHDPEVFRRWNNYTGRLCAMLRGARSDAQIGLYYPIADAQAAMYEPTPAMDSLTDELLSLNNYMENLQYNLLLNRLDYNIVNENAVLTGMLTDEEIRCGATNYRVLLMPRVTVVPLAVMRKLAAFRANGGTVLWLDSMPQMGLNVAEHAEVRRLAAEMTDGFVEFRPDNLAMRAKVTASSTDEASGYKAEYVTNGSTETHFAWEGWCSDMLPATLEIQLPQAREVNRIDIYSKQEYEQSGFDAFWFDGSDWQPLTSVSENISAHCYREFEPVFTDRFQLRFIEGCRQQPTVARLTEVQLYNRRYTPDAEDLMSYLHTLLDTTLQVEATPGSIFVSRYKRGNRRLYYIINKSTENQNVTLRERNATSCRLYQPLDGTISVVSGDVNLLLQAGRGIFLEVLDEGRENG